MAFNYARSRATAQRLITKFGKPGKIRRTSSGTGGNPWDPGSQTGGSTTDHDCVLVEITWSASERDDTLILMTDKRLLIAPEIAVEPVAGDQVVLDGAVYSIVNIEPLKPGPLLLLYDVQVR